MQFLADAVETSVKKFNANNLELLSRLSSYAPDGALARKMASTILGHLERKIPKEATLKKLLDVIACLMSSVIDPEEFLRRIGPLFSKTESRAGHESLVRVVEGLMANVLVERDIKELLKIVVDLESWDRSRIDEPDHDRRHAAYNRLNETKDISLRASSGSNLRSLIQYFSRAAYEETEKLRFLNSELIHVYVVGMRSQNEIVREECVKCLALLVDCFPDHPQLKQLSPLRNSDEDVDFFNNITHIQLHRRQRAIHRLVEQLSTEKVVIGFDVLNKYLIPMVLPYLANTESKLSALSDEGLSLLNYTMGIASWPKYVSCLDSWLKHLDKSEDNQKATIRVIVAVVEAFHYDVADVGETVDEEGTNATRVVIRDKLNREVLPRLTKCINGKI
ncbi:hypothetical protein TELCIR_02059 [Teladorsagia circumcincta]|uniref:U3 small nucleolar RNA-associated protein 20 N-terminal domain-containing protein n=1 Tax=Teladorsagia circumcincta TaxID=45464 RepID=A0A2G9V0G1_TELCI|nr:hypothetical protein TELCIR_02059 [Teladorsagia circumcincta]